MRLPGRPALVVLSALLTTASLAFACSPPQQAQQAAPTAAPAAAKPTAALVAATAAPAKPAATAAAVPAKPSGEATLVFTSFNSQVLDPSIGTPVLSDIGAPVYESLYLQYPPDAAVKPLLLESGTMAADGMSWTLKLRDGIKFSNGDPMTADDVKFSLDRYRSDESRTSQAGLFRSMVQEVQVVDRLTVKVLNKSPFITLPIYLSGKTGNEGIVMPKKYIEQVGWDTFNKQPIGSGPYKVMEHKPGQSVTYAAVENHWRATPSFTKVTYLAVPEERSRIAMLQSGQADLVSITPQARREVEQSGFKTITVPNRNNWDVRLFGTYDAYPDNPLKKLEVRKALNLAVDKKAILDSLYAGAGQVTPYLFAIPKFSLGAPDLPVTPYDPTEAKRLLAAAGYPNGFDIPIYATELGCGPAQQQFAEAIAGYWQGVGLRPQIRIEQYGTFRARYQSKLPPDLAGVASTLCQGGSGLGPRDLNTAYWSKGTTKLTDVADKEIEAANAARTEAEMIQHSEAAFRKVTESYQGVPVFSGGDVSGVSKKLEDMPITPAWNNFGMWLAREKAGATTR